MTITENLTGVVKEDHERVKTVTDILEEVRMIMKNIKGYAMKNVR